MLLSCVAAPPVCPIAAQGGGAGGDRPLSPTPAGDRYAALAIGVPLDGTEHPELDDVGAANVLYGSSAGLTAAENELWHQESSDVEDWAESGDRFGGALTAGDFDGDGYVDLAVGVPHEDLGSPEVEDAGAVSVLYGSNAGLSAAGNQLWYQDSPGIEGAG
ncbi:MAG: FG-GAP repeat protein, partial [Anaerolineae bacterium]